MSMCRRICFVALALALLGALSQAAIAAGPHGGGHMGHRRGNQIPFVTGGVGDYSGWWGGDSYYWYLYQLTRDGTIPAPPYFSLHPPVYYSYPVPRTYGFSPFAYPNDVMTPDPLAPAPQPVTMMNPYVPQKKAEPAAEQTTAAPVVRPSIAPEVVINPFVMPVVAKAEK